MTDVCEVVECGADLHKIDKFTFRSAPDLVLEPLSHHFERDTFQDAEGEPLSDHDALAVDWEWTVIPTFSDVPYDHEFFEEIEWAADEGIAGGYPDGTFRPMLPVSRAHMAALLHRFDETAPPPPVDGKAVCDTAPFPDVPVGHPLCSDIQWLVDEGIATGYPDGTFRPGMPVSRQTAAALLVRYVEGDLADCETAPFSDVPADHPFCAEILWLSEGEVVTGYPDGTFRPAEPVSRQTAVALVARLATT
jgi:hypothetical protein